MEGAAGGEGGAEGAAVIKTNGSQGQRGSAENLVLGVVVW